MALFISIFGVKRKFIMKVEKNEEKEKNYVEKNTRYYY